MRMTVSHVLNTVLPSSRRSNLVGYLALAGALVVSGAVTPALGDSVADFYKGKTMTLLIGTPPGGGNDAFGRPFMKYFVEHVPGGPKSLVVNRVGASGMKAANYLYNVAPKDGTVLGLITSSTLFLPLFGNKQAKFDPTKLSWVGNGDEIVGTCSVWHTAGIKTFEELLKKRVVFGATSAGGVSVQHASALNNLLGAKITLIKGYRGSNAVNLAMQRGEVAGACAISLAALKRRWAPDWKAGRLTPIIQTAREKNPDLKGVAHIYDYAKTKEDRQIFDLIFGRHQLGRPVSGPPGMPKDRLQALRTAFMATMKDKRFINEMAKKKMDLTPSSGAQVETFVARYFSIPHSIVVKAAKAVGK